MVIRLLCCYLFHLSNYRDVTDSYKRLKFLRNFPEKFDPNYIGAAYTICLYQFTAAFLVESANLVFLTRQENLVELMMNYVAFSGVSKLDNLYVEATHKMKSAKVILEAKGEDLKKITEALTFYKDCNGSVSNKNTYLSCEYELQFFIRQVIFVYDFLRFVYKSIYFYLFPYLIVPMSYTLYNINTDPDHDWTPKQVGPPPPGMI